MATETTADCDKQKARHPHLTGLRQDVYRFVSDNTPCLREDVARGIGLKSSTCTARIKELIDEGFLFETGDTRLSRSEVKSKLLFASDRPSGGDPLDKVRIKLTLTIDDNGRYGVWAHVVNGLPALLIAHPIKTTHITVTAPHPDTYKASIAPEKVTTVTRMDTEQHAGDIIDATAYTVSD